MANWVVGIFLLVVVGGSKCSAQFPAIYNFGDDNSDTGGSAAAFDNLDLPNGQTFFGKSSGRFSDGRVVLDFIAESLGLPYLSAYLDSYESNFKHGANFALGNQTLTQDSKLSLARQVFQFVQFKSRTIALYNQLTDESQEESSSKSVLPTPEDFSKALYIIDIGQNDLTRSIIEMDQNSTFPRMLAELTRLVNILYEYEGARFFWIYNIGPIGCFPKSIISCQKEKPSCELDQSGCVKVQNELVMEFNKLLEVEVATYKGKYPMANFTYVNVYTPKYILASEAKRRGFEDPVKFCCGSYTDTYVPCGLKELDENNGSIVMGNTSACKDPSKYISWDGVHYTEAANKVVATFILNGSLSEPPVDLPKP